MRLGKFRCHALLGQLLSLVGTSSLVCERKTKDCCGASIVSCDTFEVCMWISLHFFGTFWSPASFFSGDFLTMTSRE